MRKKPTFVAHSLVPMMMSTLLLVGCNAVPKCSGIVSYEASRGSVVGTALSVLAFPGCLMVKGGTEVADDLGLPDPAKEKAAEAAAGKQALHMLRASAQERFKQAPGTLVPLPSDKLFSCDWMTYSGNGVFRPHSSSFNVPVTAFPERCGTKMPMPRMDPDLKGADQNSQDQQIWKLQRAISTKCWVHFEHSGDDKLMLVNRSAIRSGFLHDAVYRSMYETSYQEMTITFGKKLGPSRFEAMADGLVMHFDYLEFPEVDFQLNGTCEIVDRYR